MGTPDEPEMGLIAGDVEPGAHDSGIVHSSLDSDSLREAELLKI